jgi:hypothetical protein
MGVAYNPRIVTNGLVLALDAGNAKSYPGSGTTWTDLSGNGNHCVFNATPTFSNKVFTFNGTTHYGTITNNASLNFASEQTITMILKHTYTSGRKNPWDQAYGGYGTWTHEDGNAFNYYYGDAGVNNTPYNGFTSGSTPRNVWNIYTTVRNTSNVTWYINGVYSAFQSHAFSDLTTTTERILIGAGYAGYWEGDMSAVYAYTKALSANEVKANFNALRGRYGI